MNVKNQTLVFFSTNHFSKQETKTNKKMSEKNQVLILTSNLGCEIGVGAFASLNKSIKWLSMDPSVASKETKEHEVIKTINNEFETRSTVQVLMIGTYWTKAMKVIRSWAECSLKISVYCFGEAPEERHNDIYYFEQDEDPNKWVGPMEYTRDYLIALGFNSLVEKFYYEAHKNAIRLIDDRLANRNIVETQIFQNGIEAINSNAPLRSNFEKYFSGEFKFEDVMTKGKSVMEYQISIVAARIRNNLKTVETEDGKSVLITEAPELVNWTHKSLHEKNPKADVTMTICLKFGKTGEDKDHFAFSFRSYDEKTDVSEYAKKLTTGDGKKDSACGRIEVSIPYPFEIKSSNKQEK